MKSILFTALGISTCLTLSAADESPLKSSQDKFSYVLGMNLGKELKRNSIEINYDMYIKGVKDSIGDGKTLLTDEEARQIMMTFQQELRSKQMEKQKLASEDNRKKGETFLAENKKKEGVKVIPVTLPDGKTHEIQYKIFTEGKGKKPTTTDTVVTHYRGTLIDGTEFDSSYKRSEPTTFPVTGVIKGWTEALLQMPVGSKWQLYIPSELAYGERGSPPKISPGAALIFDIELLSIKDPEKPGAPPTPAPPK